MAAVILSRPSSNTDKVLRRSEYSRDRNGLETLEETYTIRSAGRISLAPALKTLHPAFSTAGQTFARMAVDGVSFREMEGDLTEMTVTFVGLTSASGLPPALVSLVPTTGAGIKGPPAVIEVEFVSDASDAELVKGILAKGGTEVKTIPAAINGTALPPNPYPPFTGNGPGLVGYKGYYINQLEFQRRGILAVVRVTFAERYDLPGQVISTSFARPARSWNSPR